MTSVGRIRGSGNQEVEIEMASLIITLNGSVEISVFLIPSTWDSARLEVLVTNRVHSCEKQNKDPHELKAMIAARSLWTPCVQVLAGKTWSHHLGRDNLTQPAGRGRAALTK